MEELLAVKMRPKNLSEVIGQRHLIGENKILTNLVNNKKLFSMILYGKPGIGKTSIAMALVNELKNKDKVIVFNGEIYNYKEIKEDLVIIDTDFNLPTRTFDNPS